MKRLLLILLAVLANAGFGWRLAAAADSAAPAATAGDAPTPPPSAPALRSAAELEKLVMPIALHPDPLIAIILPASVYPLEIVQAARFVKDTNNIPKVNDQPWDDNVKELAKFPDMIARMDADLSWTAELGEAFLDQPKELMDTIQSLRGKAQKAGTLQSTPQQIVSLTNVVVIQTNLTQVVTVTNQIVQVQPVNPQVVYVPTYPTTVYYPPPAYVYDPFAPLITFGVGMAWGAILANNCNWGYGHVDVDVDVDRNVNRNVNRNTDRVSQRSGDRAAGTQKQWKPDQNRMRTSGATASSKEARGWSSGTGQRTSASAGARPTTGTVGSRPSTGNVANRPSTGTVGNRPSAGAAPANRPSPSTGSNRPPPNSAFSGVNNGASVRDSSNRGQASRSAGGASRGGSRGGGGRGGGGRGR